MTFTRTHMMMAASVAALAVAAPIAFQMTRGGFAPSELASVSPAKRTAEPESTTIARLDDKLAPGQPAIDGTLARSNEAAGGEKPAKRDEAKKAEAPVAAAPSDAPAGGLAPPNPPIGPAKGQLKDLVGRSQIGLDESSRPTDGLGAVGNSDQRLPYVREEERLARAEADARPAAALPSPPPAPPIAARPPDLPLVGALLSSPDINAAAGSRMLNERAKIALGADAKHRAESLAPGYNPYAHMDEADRQKQIAEQEFRDKFEAKEQSPVKQVAAEPVSTFSTDVDTASYAFVRRALNQGRLPPKDAVRVEEMINYFPYAYPKPETVEVPFQPTVTVMQSPWNASNQLVHIGIKGYDVTSAERPRANLVFLIDVSGSMTPADKLPLVKNAFRMLLDELKPDDTVGIVTYAAGSGVLLEPTKVADKAKIHRAIESLGAGGSTAGAEGIQDAYRLAEDNFDKTAVNRVILATDGDFNVGVTNQDELKGLIERKREKGIFLSILGVGEGNYNDALMQTLAQNGNGAAAYVDTLNEARKVLVDEASSTLFTIAKDVKVQIEWNPARVSEYRLIGYETRALRREDFNNDKVDAGDIGSGHTVTAIYEVTPVGAPPMVDGLRYGNGQKTAAAVEPKPAAPATASDASDRELGFLKLRYKLPKEDASKLISLPITAPLGESRAPAAWNEARFSVAVAAFGQLLKGSPYLKSFTYDDVLELARSAKGDDPFGYRSEFLSLVRLAKSARP